MTAGERSVAHHEPGLDEIRAAPSAVGTLELIVRRPAEDERELLEAAELDLRRRFGVEALKLVNSERGRALRLRGLHARVVSPGSVRRGDPVEARR